MKLNKNEMKLTQNWDWQINKIYQNIMTFTQDKMTNEKLNND